MCARSGRTTVPWSRPARTSWARHAPLLYPAPAPRPPGASGYMHSSRQHHTWAKQLEHGRPLGGAQHRGACKAKHCARSWRGLPRLAAHAATAWMPDNQTAGCGAGGSGQPRAAGTHLRARLSARRRGPSTAHVQRNLRCGPGVGLVGGALAGALQHLRAWQGHAETREGAGWTADEACAEACGRRGAGGGPCRACGC